MEISGTSGEYLIDHGKYEVTYNSEINNGINYRPMSSCCSMENRSIFN